MRNWVIIISFLISITGLLFKTTEEGKNGVKKINRWGILLLGLLIGLVTLNFYTNYQEKKDALRDKQVAEAELRSQKEKDSLRNLANEASWRSLELHNNNIIYSLRKDSVSNERIQQLQEDLILKSKEYNRVLTDKIVESQGHLNVLNYPVDTLFLSFEIKLTLKNTEIKSYYEALLKKVNSSNSFENVLRGEKGLFYDLQALHFESYFDREKRLPSYEFDFNGAEMFANVDYPRMAMYFDSTPHLIDYREMSAKPYVAIYPFDDNSITILAHNLKSRKIYRHNAADLSSICNWNCYFTLAGSTEIEGYGLEDLFDFKIIDVELSDIKRSRKISFSNFKFYDDREVWIDGVSFAGAFSQVVRRCYFR